MDVFYYWKDIREDREAGRIGLFQSSREKLDQLRAGYPSYIWIFKTPQGQKGRLQLLARLVWSDKPLVSFTPTPGDSHIFYDADHPKSIWYDGSDEEAAVDAVTHWARLHFSVAVRANFQGANGQHEMRGPKLHELVGIAKSFTERAFRVALA